MLSRENVIREVLSELEARRAQNLVVERERRKRVELACPEVKELLEERQRRLFLGMKGAFASPNKANEISANMQIEINDINKKIRQMLYQAGFKEDYLQPVYHCKLCRDTGYVGEPIHEQCNCLKSAVLNRLYESEGLKNLEQENFFTFDESIFPDTPIEGRKNTQKGYTRLIRKHCEEYANSFFPEEGKGILLCGKSGLGKTFLMNCVAQRVLERGYSVVIISSYKLIEIMRKYQFQEENAEQLEDIISCDLLCIDDLGSEPMIKGVTVSSIYHILNERRNANRAIVATTNLSVEQLYDYYEDRIAARICDKSRMMILPFVGVDVRRFAAKGL